MVGREATRMRPHRVAGGAELDGHDAGRGVVEQLPVVADEEDRLLRLVDPLLEPELARHVEEVVRLVEQQHLVRSAQQELQHEPLLLATGQRREVAVLRPVVGQAERRRRAHVPDDLDVVAAGVGPLGQRRGVAHLGLLVVGVHQRQLARLDVRGRLPDPRRRHRQEQLGHGRRARADHLAHHAEATGPRHRPGVRHEVAGDDPQQGRLAGTVGADQGHLGALADAERHVVEQHPPVRQLVAHSGDVHVSHGRQSPPRRTPDANPLAGRPGRAVR